MASGEPSHSTLSYTMLSVCSTLLSEVECGRSQDIFGGATQQISGEEQRRAPMLQNQSYGPGLTDMEDTFSTGSKVQGIETIRYREDCQDVVSQDVSNSIESTISGEETREIDGEGQYRALLRNHTDGFDDGFSNDMIPSRQPQTDALGLKDHQEDHAVDIEGARSRNLIRLNSQNFSNRFSGDASPRQPEEQDTNSESSESHKLESEDDSEEEQTQSEAKFLCAECGKKFNSQRTYFEHSLIHTGERPYECKYCGKSFRQNNSLYFHERIHTGVKPYVCHICDKRFAQRGTLKTHIRCHTGEKPYKCSFCDRTFNQRSSCNLHEKIHKNDRSFTCNDCGMSFRRKDALQVHQRGSGTTRKCKDCDEAFQTLCALKTHRVQVHNEKLFTCNVCHASFSTKTKLEKHKPCDSYKETVFMSSKYLKVHPCEHSEKRNFLCTKCGMVFQTKKNLERHVSVHGTSEKISRNALYHGEDIHVGAEQKTLCDSQRVDGSGKRDQGNHNQQNSEVDEGRGKQHVPVCDLKSPSCSDNRENEKHEAETKSDDKDSKLMQTDLDSSGNLVEGVQTSDKKFVCPHCGKVFAFRRSFMAHVRTHKKGRPHMCTVCGISFKQRAALDHHSCKHTGAKPYVCSVCKRSFSTLYSLRDHEYVHTGAKPYKCKICDMAFSQRSNRYHHELAHDNKKPFRCEVCGISYAQKAGLVSHKQKARKLKKCPCCGDKFENRCALYVHQDASHCDEDHVCQGCNRRFSTAARLEGHLPCDPSLSNYYVCGNCKKSFDNRDLLSYHDCPKGVKDTGTKQKPTSDPDTDIYSDDDSYNLLNSGDSDSGSIMGSEKDSCYPLNSERDKKVTEQLALSHHETIPSSEEVLCHVLDSKDGTDINSDDDSYNLLNSGDSDSGSVKGSEKDSCFPLNSEEDVIVTEQLAPSDHETIPGSEEVLCHVLDSKDGVGRGRKRKAVFGAQTVDGSEKVPKHLSNFEGREGIVKEQKSVSDPQTGEQMIGIYEEGHYRAHMENDTDSFHGGISTGVPSRQPHTNALGSIDHQENLSEDIEGALSQNLMRLDSEHLPSRVSGGASPSQSGDQETNSESSDSHKLESEDDGEEERTQSETKFLCAECGKEYNSQRAYYEHSLIHTRERPYECKYCGKSFRQNNSLFFHERIHTGVKPYVCHICDKRFAQRGTLTTHIRCHTGEKPYKCSFCDRAFNQQNSRNLHEKVHKNVRSFSCNDCGMTFRRKDALQVHQRGSGVTRKCKDCGVTFQTLCALKVHRSHVHNEKLFTCNVCNASFSSETKLEKHRPCDSGKEALFICKKCGQKFKTPQELSIHDCSLSSMGSVKCECGKIFMSQKELEVHRCEHSEKRNFLCANCGMLFQTKKNLERHVSVHDASEKSSHNLLYYEDIHVGQEQKAVCASQTVEVSGKRDQGNHNQQSSEVDEGRGKQHVPVCDLKSPSCSDNRENEKHQPETKSDDKDSKLMQTDLDSSGNLVQGVQTSDKKFDCAHCGKVFAFRRSFMAHVRTHEKGRPHMCSVCGISFKQRAALDHHSCKHTGAKPYVCSVCKRSFSTLYSLRDHAIVHTGAKPYKCKICDMAFNQRSNRYHHELAHVNKKPFRCEVCGISYAQKAGLVSHKQKAGKLKKCAHCGDKFENRCALYVHQDASHCDEDHVCQGCNRRFSTAARLEGHLPCDPSLSNYYVCGNCKNTFNSRGLLDGHNCDSSN